MRTHTVLLKSGTIGTIHSDELDNQSPMDFEEIKVRFFDWNGNYREEIGAPEEVLESR